jgi:hypothetical protein
MLSLTSLANLPLLVGALLSISVPTFGAAYTATYLPSNVPKTTEDGQTGTNQVRPSFIFPSIFRNCAYTCFLCSAEM